MATLWTVCCELLLLLSVASSKPQTSRPNIVFILTDDQDVALNGEVPIAKTRQLIGANGVTFDNMFVTSPLCCPSRSSILTGKYVHNHGALNNSLPGNCSSVAWQRFQEPLAFPAVLKKHGYSTFFAGKYLNMYGLPEAGGVEHVPPGWDHWNGLVGNSVYYNYSLSVNGKMETHGDNYNADYLTDVIHRRGIEFLQQQRPGGSPFFAMFSTPACHAPFTPAPQYASTFPNMAAPRDPSFSSCGKDKHWLIRQAICPMPPDTVDFIDETFRNRWRTLLSVDDLVEDVVATLEQRQLTDSTYVIFSSDNGFHLGQFSLSFDKRQLYDFDIRVPLMVCGPSVPKGMVIHDTVLNIDLAPTFLELAGLVPPPHMDGLSFAPLLHGRDRPPRDAFLVEHYGEGAPSVPGCPQYDGQYMEICDMHCVCEDTLNNTYACVRTENNGQTYKMCRFQDYENFMELYDLSEDQFELSNLANDAPANLVNTLSVWLQYLSTCRGKDCSSRPRDVDMSNLSQDPRPT